MMTMRIKVVMMRMKMENRTGRRRLVVVVVVAVVMRRKRTSSCAIELDQ